LKENLDRTVTGAFTGKKKRETKRIKFHAR